MDHNNVSPTSAIFSRNDCVNPLIIVIQINDKQIERSCSLLLKSIINIYWFQQYFLRSWVSKMGKMSLFLNSFSKPSNYHISPLFPSQQWILFSSLSPFLSFDADGKYGNWEITWIISFNPQTTSIFTRSLSLSLTLHIFNSPSTARSRVPNHHQRQGWLK